jgi:hypothetical protein
LATKKEVSLEDTEVNIEDPGLIPSTTTTTPRNHAQSFDMDRFFLLIAPKREATLFKYMGNEGIDMMASMSTFQMHDQLACFGVKRLI